MIELYYGRAFDAARAQLLTSGRPGVLVIAQDEVAAASLRRESAVVHGGGELAVLPFDALLDRLFRGSAGWREDVISNRVCRAVLRNVLESDLPAFDYLVGENSVQRISQGVLSRIMAAADVLASEPAVEGDGGAAAESPRRRQMRELALRFEERLSGAGLQREKHATWQGIIDLTTEQWTAAFPGVERVIFSDFAVFADEVYLAVAAISKQVTVCRVLLDFDPDDDGLGASPVATAFPRLCDMATRQIGPDDDGEQHRMTGDDFAGSDQTPLLITCPTVSAEIAGCARMLAHVVKANEGRTVLPVVVAVSNVQGYAGRLEKALAVHGLTWHWMTAEVVGQRSEVLLLERLRACSGNQVTGAAVSDLFRTPGFAALLDMELSSVEAWDMASRLDYGLALTGLLKGWKAILKQVRRTFSNLNVRRKRTSHWTPDEEALDARLLEILTKTSVAVDAFSGKKPVAEWAAQVTELLARFQRAAGVSSEKGYSELRAILDEMLAVGSVIAPDEVSLHYFVTLLRTTLHGVMTEPGGEHDILAADGVQVLLCEPEVASRISADHCVVLGFNDGAFPRFTRVDVSFLGHDGHVDQRPGRSRQWHALRRILKQYRNVQLWMPAREGTEDLLPSQFAELLAWDERVRRISVEQYLAELRSPEKSQAEIAAMELVSYLGGVELSEQEMERFRRIDPVIYNAVRGMTVLTARRRDRLSVYDGILTDPRLKSWLAAWIDRHTFSVSQLDGIVGCSFRFFADRMLNLEEQDETDGLLPAHVFGSFVHDVLARFYRGWVAAGRGALCSEDEALAREDVLRAYYAEYDPADDLTEFARDLMNLKLFGHLGPEKFGEAQPVLEDAGDTGVLGRFLLLEMQRGDNSEMDFLQPANFEVGFGVTLTEEEDPLSTPDCVVMDVGGGNKVKLWGRIDRIDVSETGVFAVTDYKTGQLPTGPQIAGGFRTQLPVYMLVAQELLSKKFDQAQPAGGLYYSLKRGRDAKISGVFARSAFKTQLGLSRGMSDDQFEETLVMVKERIRHSMNALRRGYLTTTQHDPDTVCKFCIYQKMCYRDVERTAKFWEAVEAEEQEGNVEPA